MAGFVSALPIDTVLPDIRAALERTTRLVLAAPPGAGKTTRVPLDLLTQNWRGDGRIIVLEPRRIAARMAAERMASTLNERVGQTVGLRTRLDTRISRDTRIEVVTEGVFTRMILNDPALEGVAAVLFDEFHERALTADLGLALALESQSALREDLRIVLMSATLDTGAMASRIGAEVIESEGRAFSVDTRYLGRDRDERIEDAMARAIRRALSDEEGSVLAFLPGQGEILRTLERLSDLRMPNVDLSPLYGALDAREQDRAVQPAPKGRRKVVLATDLAESSLTIEGVRVVIDSGLARLPETDAATGLSRLVTRRAARANVDQRRGRAGRTAPGVCYRLWHEAETRGLASAPTPEILTADLTGLVLDLLSFGEADPSRLTWLDPPPEGRVRAARRVLTELGAIDRDQRLTERGRQLATLPLPPRVGTLVLAGAELGDPLLGAELAVLVSERGAGGPSTDLATRLARLRNASGPQAERHRSLARNWAALVPSAQTKPASRPSPDSLLLSALPGRIARARDREKQPGLYLLASGEGARLEATDPLAKHTWLTVLDLAGGQGEARITAAAALSEAQVKPFEATTEIHTFDAGRGEISARRVKRIGAIILSETPLPAPRGEAARTALVSAVKAQGLAILPPTLQSALDDLLARIALLRATFGNPWPDWTADMLAARAEDWLAPLIQRHHRFDAIPPGEAAQSVSALLDWPLPRDLDRLAPRRFEGPTGSTFAIDYTGDQAPRVALRVQEVYGLASHPAIADGRVPLTLDLLSPAHRQIALTRDLPGFWSGGYHDMRKDMRGRYPKHDWPEDPASTQAHTGKVRRKT